MRRLLTVLALCSCLLFAGCDGPDVRTAAKSAHRATEVLRALREAKVSFLRNGKITQEESDDITRLLLDGVATVKVLNDRANEWQTVIETEEKKLLTATPEQIPAINAEIKRLEKVGGAQLRPLIQDAIRSLKELNNKGVLRIKNKETRDALSALLDIGALFA